MNKSTEVYVEGPPCLCGCVCIFIIKIWFYHLINFLSKLLCHKGIVKLEKMGGWSSRKKELKTYFYQTLSREVLYIIQEERIIAKCVCVVWRENGLCGDTHNNISLVNIIYDKFGIFTGQMKYWPMYIFKYKRDVLYLYIYLFIYMYILIKI